MLRYCFVVANADRQHLQARRLPVRPGTLNSPFDRLISSQDQGAE